MQTLNLGWNRFEGLFPAHGFEKLSVLRKLETLNLEHNEFNNNLLPSLSALTSLKTLNIAWNKLEGLLPAHELAYLGNVETLDLSSNQLSGIQGCETLSRLKKLETLSLSDNHFNKSIILCLSSLISLKNLFLQFTNLGDSFPARELTVLENLEMLDLFGCGFSSLTLQDSKLLSKWSKMRHLDLSRNSFDKDILRILGALPSLKFLSLDYNAMEGPLSNQGLASFNHLEILDLQQNGFHGSVPPFIGASSLKALYLSSNKFNGSLPIQGLCELKKLEELDLSDNHIEGILPPCLSNLTSLRLFDLYGNQFTGNHLSSLLGSLNSLEYIDLS
ncbi:unnamed protein product [Camellia sinensis]